MRSTSASSLSNNSVSFARSSIRLPTLTDIDTALAEQSLRDYLRHAWTVVEPATPFVPGNHLDAVCDHLEAVTRGEIRNLIITMPPRCAKSLLVAVFWPSWEWIRAPHRRWLFASYSLSLSVRDSLKCRRILESPWYRTRWGDRFTLTGDQNLKSRFENDKTGYRIALSVGSSVTGEGGDRIVIDDPHNVSEIFSDTIREGVLTWWDQVMSTRLNDRKTGARVIVQQRLHERDLAGYLLAKGGWDHLNLPMEYEGQAVPTRIGWRDWRTAPGELLWPARFGEREVAEMKAELGSYGAAGQLQQRPAPLGGGIIKLTWFKRYRTPPAARIRIVQSWDTAQKATDMHDPWVCTTWQESPEGYFLLDVYRKRMEYPEGKRAVQSLAAHWTPVVILIEDKSAGASILQDLRLETRLPVLAIEPEADKVTRMAVETPAIEAGRVWLPESAPWLVEYERELASFPHGAHDDQVDSTSQFLRWARTRAASVRYESVARYGDGVATRGTW